MPKTEPFDQLGDRYAAWFEKHPAAYRSELAAVRELWPDGANGIEIGVGAGHFAAPLGILRGVEPSERMRLQALKRKIGAVSATAENLSFPDASFDAALMVTTICFVDDPQKSLQEMFRVLRPGGCAVIAFVDRDSPLGREYESKRAESPFYRNARFFNAAEVTALMKETGLVDLEYRQTLFTHPGSMRAEDPVRPGFGEGAFVVIRGRRPGAQS
ncbi:MAG: class I SAM-dependent methyltransferase [Kiritimatiellae bacterium]|nr:class I SAM-dependent methyltransferase [Kiritimatiellia bacterium]